MMVELRFEAWREPKSQPSTKQRCGCMIHGCGSEAPRRREFVA